MFAKKFVAVATLLFVPIACGDDGDEVQDEIEGTVDCTQICARYNTCVEDVDESDCIDLCEDTADNSQAGEEAASTCEDCLDGKTCEEAQSCWAGCPVAAVDE